MYEDQKIAAVVPCYNEESQITSVLDTIPDFVDKIIVIDDNSKDSTQKIAKEYSGVSGYIRLIDHQW